MELGRISNQEGFRREDSEEVVMDSRELVMDPWEVVMDPRGVRKDFRMKKDLRMNKDFEEEQWELG